jgi:hypothetical protein
MWLESGNVPVFQCSVGKRRIFSKKEAPGPTGRALVLAVSMDAKGG